MSTVLIVLSIIILTMSILMWLGVMMWLGAAQRVKCRDCAHFRENFITGYQGQGLYRFGYCQLLIYDCKMVDPDVERQCNDFEKKVGEEVPSYEGVSQEDTKLPLDAG